MSAPSTKNQLFSMVVVVAALGYFVDIFDLLLFGMIRTVSLRDIGITDKESIERIGMMLDNWQMAGMLIGGIAWGVLGDKKGRVSVLFGSIITYSLANIANGFVQDTTTYAVLRFIAGFGLAGELGAGITLVNETLSKEKRGLGTTLVASVGILGAVAGGFIVKWVNDWRICYFIGGGMGLLLLILRISVYESGMYQNIKTSNIIKGNFIKLLTNRKQLTKYMAVILIAVPIWYVVQLYAKYSPELADAMGVPFEEADKKNIAINSIMLTYLGLTLGDLACGLISHYLRSRKKALSAFMIGAALSIAGFFLFAGSGPAVFYFGVTVLGFMVGYWAVFMSTAAESFGTNIRSTVTSTAPNFVRGAVIGVNSLYAMFKYDFHTGTIAANLLTGAIVFGLAIWAWRHVEETFGKDLDYVED
ncbi:MAG TPA: MFS transporter [Parasegetibacter sp.]